MTENAKETFIEEVNKADDSINLAYAALLMTEHLTQPFAPHLYLNMLHQWADQIRPDMAAAQTDEVRIHRLNQAVFEDLNFTGNQDNYYAADNSFLNRVIETRQGIPISLSVVYLEIGWLLNLPLCGVGIPFHFVVGYGEPEIKTFIDVFNRGRSLTEEDCLADLAQLPASDLEHFRRDYVKPLPKKSILYRMLNNLKLVYIKAQDWEASYKTVDLMLQLMPNAPDEVRDRGLIAYRLERLSEAIFDINQYLILAPNARDAEWLREHVGQIALKLARLN